jgi:hypothetical protein
LHIEFPFFIVYHRDLISLSDPKERVITRKTERAKGGTPERFRKEAIRAIPKGQEPI